MTKLTPQGPMKRSKDENTSQSEPVMKKSKLTHSGDDGGGHLKFVKTMRGSTNSDSLQGGFQGRGGHGGRFQERGGRGGRFRGRGRGCYNCGKNGHHSRDCKQPQKGGVKGGGNCFNCGEPGHISKDCSQPRKEQQSDVKQPVKHKNGSTQPNKAKLEKWNKSKPHVAMKRRKLTASQRKATEAQQKFIKLFDEKDKCTLFMKGFPKDTSESNIKALSNDIVAVRLTQFADKRFSFAHLEFESEELAEKNLKVLKQKKIGENNLIVDYIGTKSSYVRPVWPLVRKGCSDVSDLDPKKLHVTGIEPDTSPDKLKLKFPKATEIWIKAGRPGLSHALVVFQSVDDAIDGLDANTKYDIRAVFARIFGDNLNYPLTGPQLESIRSEFTIKTYKEEAPEEAKVADEEDGDEEEVCGDDKEEGDNEEEEGEEDAGEEDEGTETVPAKKATLKVVNSKNTSKKAAKNVAGHKKTATKVVDSKKASKKKAAVKKFESLDDKEHDGSNIADDDDVQKPLVAVVNIAGDNNDEDDDVKEDVDEDEEDDK